MTANISSNSFATARSSYKDIKERDVKPVVMSWLSAAQRELLDKHAPERLYAAEWPDAESGLRGRQIAAHRAADSGALRREPDAEDCAGPRAGGGAYPDAGHETDSSDAGPRRVSGASIIRKSNPSCSGNIRSICGDECEPQRRRSSFAKAIGGQWARRFDTDCTNCHDLREIYQTNQNSLSISLPNKTFS